MYKYKMKFKSRKTWLLYYLSWGVGGAHEVDAGEDEDLDDGRIFSIPWSTGSTEWSIERLW